MVETSAFAKATSVSSLSPTCQLKMWFGMVARPVGAVFFVLDVLAQDRRVRVHRLERIDDHGKRFIFDLDQVRGVGGDIAVVGDDEGDLLVLEQNLAVGEHHLDVACERRHPREIDPLEVLGG